MIRKCPQKLENGELFFNQHDIDSLIMKGHDSSYQNKIKFHDWYEFDFIVKFTSDNT